MEEMLHICQQLGYELLNQVTDEWPYHIMVEWHIYDICEVYQVTAKRQIHFDK